MRKRALVFVALLLLSACGNDPVFIADSVRFQVNFDTEVVKVVFDLNAKYSLPLQDSMAFDQLGQVNLNLNTQKQSNSVSASLLASPDALSRPWPSSSFASFPNQADLPDPIASAPMQEWKKNSADLEYSLVFENSSTLNFGGGVFSQNFNDLPKDFLATQYFKDRAGKQIASISAVGPTENSRAGLYFFVFLGLNPFENRFQLLDRLKSFEIPSDKDYIKEYRILASDPTEVQSELLNWHQKLHLFEKYLMMNKTNESTELRTRQVTSGK